jgi:hypothetical protein
MDSGVFEFVEDTTITYLGYAVADGLVKTV